MQFKMRIQVNKLNQMTTMRKYSYLKQICSHSCQCRVKLHGCTCAICKIRMQEIKFSFWLMFFAFSFREWRKCGPANLGDHNGEQSFWFIPWNQAVFLFDSENSKSMTRDLSGAPVISETLYCRFSLYIRSLDSLDYFFSAFSHGAVMDSKE